MIVFTNVINGDELIALTPSQVSAALFENH